MHKRQQRQARRKMNDLRIPSRAAQIPCFALRYMTQVYNKKMTIGSGVIIAATFGCARRHHAEKHWDATRNAVLITTQKPS